MNKNDITYCLFSSTKGHFDRHDRYKLTVENMLSQIPAEIWSKLLAHIKISSGEESIFEEMKKFLEMKGFEVIGTVGEWKHGNDGKDNSHQVEYIKDMIELNKRVKTPYFFHSEDDWLIKVDDKQLLYWIFLAQRLLIDEPNLIQVRIPRFGNEFERINQLKRKHNIDAAALKVDDQAFIHNDWSNNPYLARTRDMRAALTLVMNNAFPMHSEHGVGRAMKLFGWTQYPLVCLNPTKIHCSHIGTKIGEEDNLDNPAMETLIQ